MNRDAADALNDILVAISKAQDFIRGMSFEQFARDDKTIFAVIRALEIIGESVRHVPAAVRHKDKSIPWSEMARMRNKLIHEYFGVNTKVVWKTVRQDLPAVKKALEAML